MIRSEFTINKTDFITKKKSVLKQKIIRTLKAYTLQELVFDEDENTVTCKISVQKYGMVKKMDKLFTTFYYTEDIPDNELESTLVLHITTVAIDPA